jgi:hypothetical protein
MRNQLTLTVNSLDYSGKWLWPALISTNPVKHTTSPCKSYSFWWVSW